MIDTGTIRDHSFALAVEVIRDRIQRLPTDDANDLHELLPALFSSDEEEVEAAAQAVAEILAARPVAIRPLEVENGAEPLQQWIEHASRRIRKLRKERGLTQEQLAERAGLPQSYISRLENGEHSPTAKTIEKLARGLGVPAKEIDPSAE